MLGNSLGYVAAACLFMSMGGCAVFKGRVAEPPSRTEQPAAPAPREESAGQPDSQPSASRPSGPAVQALIAKAEEHVRAEDFQQAAASLERALHIEPKNPVIYSQLAGVMLAQELPNEAENLARKSNSLAGNWPSLQAKNWMTIARAMRARGESASADAAEMRARELQKLAGE